MKQTSIDMYQLREGVVLSLRSGLHNLWEMVCALGTVVAACLLLLLAMTVVLGTMLWLYGVVGSL